ncbi:hypothetical protein [Flavobacterium piscis]|uniref:Uncharacterized protein n=1 Tax=Flavobacterium piscis TaxID=1114874 RepID=A0ABU1YEK7_9FLAO|nr:hypothetical protein [Flavobacterium piscis]MDR7212065.1 hypothetical protein [Flavobacterium piscis]
MKDWQFLGLSTFFKYKGKYENFFEVSIYLTYTTIKKYEILTK